MQDIIQAIPTVVSQNKGVQFILIVPQDTKKKAGFIRSTVDEQDYKEILTEYADNITWVPGARGETLQKWIATADLVCLPSHAEGFGFAIAEVCAMGKPLITTSVASIPEVVSGEIIFVEPANPGQIAEQVSAYFNGSAKLHTITPKIFTRDSCIQSVISVYQELLDHSSKK